ncbi:MAG: precorrin-3B C(17)-methyltransferase [Rhizobiales bacterium]|nr:precorrin-3B C(17)-methyltransferase [Hyphomicrobiales bacterium]
MVSAPAIIVLGPSGLSAAEKVAFLVEGKIHGLAKRVDGTDVPFENTLAHLQSLFAAGQPIIGVCAAGILIRALGPLASDKTAEPPVLAVSEDGASIVPLLGGHHGANDLAREIAAGLNGHAAITTAGDVSFGLALDAPPAGWTLANPEAAKPFMAALLAGQSTKLTGDAPWLQNSDVPLAPDASLEILVTEQVSQAQEGQLIYHPRSLALGVGCERGCSSEELIEHVDATLQHYKLAAASIACVTSIDVKADETAVHAVAAHLGVPARFFSADALNAEAPRLANPSDIVLAEVGCPGVAEGAALAMAGEDAVLMVEKSKSKRATCAVAKAPDVITPAERGRKRGHLSVVGLGPGAPDWRSPEASRLLRQASDWVGYGLYLDLAADLDAGKELHRFDLGAEELRVRAALELAAQGKDVALVCSGDAGIYAMATLVFEVMAEHADPAVRRVAVTVAPGISAFQAAAAKAGAPIGHDFCTISLSDLLTPWEIIEQRLHAAAEGDFVVAFYNPKSMRRTDQIVRAMAILGQHRPPSTPVIIASSLGRPEEHVRVRTLAEFDSGEVDMLTLVMVGSSETRTLQTGDGATWTYTPRGYAKKREAAE